MARKAPIQVVGTSAVIANIYKARGNVSNRIRNINGRWGERVWSMARAESPYDTGRLRGSHNLTFSRDRLAFTVFPDPRIFAAEGLPYYPLWVHEGTSRMGARPWLLTVFNRESPGYRGQISSEIRRVLR